MRGRYSSPELLAAAAVRRKDCLMSVKKDGIEEGAAGGKPRKSLFLQDVETQAHYQQRVNTCSYLQKVC